MSFPSPQQGRTHQLVLRFGAPGSETDLGLMLPNRDPKLFQMQPYPPFAPAAREGEAGNRDFNWISVWEIHNDFSGGVGHVYEKQIEGGDYEFAQGQDLTGATSNAGPTLFTNKRKALLCPPENVAAGSIGTFKQFIQFNSAWYAVTNATPGVIYKWDATGVTPSVVETLTTACTQLFQDGTTLYAAQGASNVARKTTDGTTWSDCAYNANVHAIRDENILVYAYGSTLVPGTGYPATVAIGWTGTTINTMVYFQNAIWIGKPEGLWRFQYGRVSEVFPVAEQYNTSNFTKMCVHKGLLYFNVQNHLFFTNGDGKFIDMFPDDTNGFAAINCLYPTFGPLLISAKMNARIAADARNYVFLFDGPEHPGLNPVWSDGATEKSIIGCGATNVFDTTKVRVYLSQTTYGEQYLKLTTNYEPDTYHQQSTMPTVYYSHIYLTDFTAGFRTVPKWGYCVVLNIRNPATTTFAKVWYRVDGATSWTQSQDKDGNAHTLTLGATPTQIDKVGTYLPRNLTWTTIQFKIEMWTSTNASSAEISYFTLRGAVKPKPRYQFAFPVDCSENVVPLHGGQPESGDAIRNAIITSSQLGYPVKLCDLDGNWHLVDYRPPAPQTMRQGFMTPDGIAPERMFSIMQLVFMEIDPLDSSGNLSAWTAG